MAKPPAGRLVLRARRGHPARSEAKFTSRVIHQSELVRSFIAGVAPEAGR